MPQGTVPPVLTKSFRQQPPFGGGGKRGQIGGGDRIGAEFGARVLGQAGAVAQERVAGTASVEIGRDVIAGQHAVAVEKQKVVALCQAGTGVSGAGQSEAIMGLRGEPHRETGLRGKVVDECSGAIGRAIIADDHLESAIHAALGRDRGEHEREMAGLLIGVDDQGDIASGA